MPEFTYAEVADHKTKKDLYLVVHDKVYDASSFVDEHPGGEEVLLDVGGQDATEAFEDVGHSDEACAILEKLAVGDLKRLEGDKKPTSNPGGVHTPTAANAGTGITTYILLLVGVLVALAAYQYQQNKDN